MRISETGRKGDLSLLELVVEIITDVLLKLCSKYHRIGNATKDQCCNKELAKL